MSDAVALTPRAGARLQQVLRDGEKPIGVSRYNTHRQVCWVKITTEGTPWATGVVVQAYGDGTTEDMGATVEVKPIRAGEELKANKEYIAIRTGNNADTPRYVAAPAGCPIDEVYVDAVTASISGCTITLTTSYGRLECPEKDPPTPPPADTVTTITLPTQSITYLTDVSVTCVNGAITVTKTSATKAVVVCS